MYYDILANDTAQHRSLSKSSLYSICIQHDKIYTYIYSTFTATEWHISHIIIDLKCVIHGIVALRHK